MRAERGATAGAMRGNLIALIHQALIPKLLYYPPAGFNILIIHSDIGMLQVNPEGDALGHCLPFLEVTKDALPAASVKSVNAIFLNLGFTGKAQVSFHFQLYRQSVCIPTCDAGGVIALHCLIAWYNILEYTSQHMMYAWATISRRWSLI